MPMTSSSRQYELPPNGATGIRLLLEEEILEIYTASQYGAYRLRPAPRINCHFWLTHDPHSGWLSLLLVQDA